MNKPMRVDEIPHYEAELHIIDGKEVEKQVLN